MTSSSLSNKISFWGSIASIVALLLVFWNPFSASVGGTEPNHLGVTRIDAQTTPVEAKELEPEPKEEAAAVGAIPLRVRFRRAKDELDFGTIGESYESVRPDDLLEVRVSLGRPMRFYLLSLGTDGSVQLCWPPEETDVPEPRASLTWPIDGYEFLAASTGAQGFLLIASDDLGAYLTWRERATPIAWKNTSVESPLAFDGENFPPFGLDRGTLRRRNDIPEEFRKLCVDLTDQWPDFEVRSVLVPVREER